MTNDSGADANYGKSGALAAMIEASEDPHIVNDYRSIARGFDSDDYQAIVDISWRHQFNDDRLNFKRDIRELQQDVSRRALERMDQTQ